MSETPPIGFVWTGEVMQPLDNFRRLAAKHYGEGEIAMLAPHEPRSRATHNHYFACIADAWGNLPDEQVERFPSPEHLRRWALIKAGYADCRTFPCASKAEAQRLAAFLKPMDPFALVVITEAVVTVYTAQSQSHRAMGKRAFAESKEKVLAIVSNLIGTDAAALQTNAQRAA